MGSLNKTDGIPLYIKIRQLLHDDIMNKVLLPGQKISSEDELAAKYGVSRMTVRQGISDLLDESILYRKHGVGTFVAQPQVSRDHTRLTNFFETSQVNHVEATMRVLIADIEGGIRCGLETILVLSGVTSQAEAEQSSIKSDWMVRDIAELSGLL
jgi:DNA-binding GntR family transcriptional regulator